VFTRGSPVQANVLGLDIHPDPTWPGLTAPAGQIRADPEAMRAAAKDLNAAAQQIRNAPQVLHDGTYQTTFGPGVWTAALQLERANALVRDAIKEYVTYMAQTVEEAAAAIDAAASQIENSDHRNQANATRTDSALGGGSGSGEVQAWTR
jgi:uncharacterized protein YukE